VSRYKIGIFVVIAVLVVGYGCFRGVQALLDFPEESAKRGYSLCIKERIFITKKGDYKVSHWTRPEQFFLWDLDENTYIDKIDAYKINEDEQKMYVVAKNGVYLIFESGEILFCGEAVDGRRHDVPTILKKVKFEDLAEGDRQEFDKLVDFYKEYGGRENYNPNIEARKLMLLW
jgi:hypothetical protein